MTVKYIWHYPDGLQGQELTKKDADRGAQVAGWWWVEVQHPTVAYWRPSQTDLLFCAWCGWHRDDHQYDGTGYTCRAAVTLQGQTVPMGPPDPWGLATPPTPIRERTCKKCRNKSLRLVTLPDTLEFVVMCRLCGQEHPL